ncbi:sigma-70 family RNA polymerase sigma factor [Rosistilla oblonga]|uniref:RNA polymerase sigma factor n=1 Tax=Rosistilla oblonga TaxID=2527990 RepID=A0A518IR98_9BACT|nr:sigma-70 family RNA polymerase sigma factor [Rosistilla oblonga]QDV55612.1 RNA polymerase sigma factor [Rosistilla oblonga]
MKPLFSDRTLERETIAIVRMFSELRPEIKQMIERHLDVRIRRRVDASDIVQSTFIDASKRVERYLNEQPMPVRQWLFYLAKMKAFETNHHHLLAKKRDARREHDADALQGVGSDQSTPSQCFARKETNRRLGGALNRLPYRYRLVIELRHFQAFSNKQVSSYLELSEKAASKLYMRAIEKLRVAMACE